MVSLFRGYFSLNAFELELPSRDFESLHLRKDSSERYGLDVRTRLYSPKVE